MKALELFAGAGGLGIGLSLAGFKPVQVVEWDRWCCDTIRANRSRKVLPLKNWPAPTEGDVRDIDFHPLLGKLAIVSGGPPCQPFSLGGKHKAFDDRRDMWSEAVRAVRETQPTAFIFENVKGLKRSAFATYLEYIERQLEYPLVTRNCDEDWLDHLKRLEQHHSSGGGQEDLGYRVLYQVLNSADYGVPQRRERIVFVGIRRDRSIVWNFPQPTHSVDRLIWDQVSSNAYWERHRVAKAERGVSARATAKAHALDCQPAAKPWQTVRDALHDLPDPVTSATAASLINGHKYQPGARSYAGHTGSPLDEPAKTLKAGVHGVPGGENMLLRNDGTVRYFTVRESARLQGFPDTFQFHGAWSEAMRQLGNAVPVGLAEVIGKSVYDALRKANAASSLH
jgi:DNA (cytosine-5)-methyltransferase 1